MRTSGPSLSIIIVSWTPLGESRVSPMIGWDLEVLRKFLQDYPDHATS